MFFSIFSRRRRVFQGLAIVLLGAALGGCVTAAQKRGKVLAQANKTEYEEMRTCIDAVHNLPVYAPAARRVPVDYDQATLEQETDPSIARDVEISAVLLANPQINICRKKFLDKIKGENPSLVPVYANMMSLSESSLYEVMQKKKSWGDHVHDVKLMQSKAAIEVDSDIEKIADGLNQEPKAVQERREAANKAIEQYLLTQKALATMRRPIITQ